LLGATDTMRTVSAGSVHRKASRILIVEDDENTLDRFARLLRLHDYGVYTASSADAGLRVLEVTRVDAKLVDILLPEVSGLVFLRQVRGRADCGNTPVAVVTGNYFVDDAVGAELKALRVEVRFKPLWLEDLTTLVQELLIDV